MMAASTHVKGREGEDRAARYLEDTGWSVLARNYRSRWGEIDIVARKGCEVGFFEVKSWSTLPQGELEHSVTFLKRARIIRTARVFLGGRRDLSEKRLRFDVLFLGGKGQDMVHIENAFEAGGIDRW